MPLTLFHDVVPPQHLVPEVPWQFYNLQGKKVTIKKLLALSISNSIVETLFGKKKLYKE